MVGNRSRRGVQKLKESFENLTIAFWGDKMTSNATACMEGGPYH